MFVPVLCLLELFPQCAVRISQTVMRSLEREDVTSICCILFLRLAHVPPPHRDLCALWQVDALWLDDLMKVSLEALRTGDVIACASLHCILDVEWWRLRLFSLFTLRGCLMNLCKTTLRRLNVTNAMTQELWACLWVFSRRFHETLHEALFPDWNALPDLPAGSPNSPYLFNDPQSAGETVCESPDTNFYLRSVTGTKSAEHVIPVSGSAFHVLLHQTICMLCGWC